jgi:hypothetical protein
METALSVRAQVSLTANLRTGISLGFRIATFLEALRSFPQKLHTKFTALQLPMLIYSFSLHESPKGLDIVG